MNIIIEFKILISMNPVAGRTAVGGMYSPEGSDASRENNGLTLQQAPYYFSDNPSDYNRAFVSSSEFSEFNAHVHQLLYTQIQKLKTCEERITQLESENARLKFQQEQYRKNEVSNQMTLPVLTPVLETMNSPPASSSTHPDAKDSSNSKKPVQIDESRIQQQVPCVPVPLDPINYPKGKVHLMGGINHSNKLNRTVEVLDRRSELWKEVCKMPMDLHCVNSSAVVLDYNKVFIMSAFPSIHQNFKLSFLCGVIDHWCMAPCQQNNPPCFGSFAALDDKIFSIGGYHYSTTNQAVDWSSSLVPFPLDCSELKTVSTVESYDPGQGVWIQLQSLCDGIIRPALVPCEPHGLYCLGGLVAGDQCLRPTNAVQRYDNRKGSWEKLDTMQHCRACFGAVGRDYSILALGGITTPFYGNEDCVTNATDSVEEYDLRMNRWRSLKPLERERCGFTCHVLYGDEICVLGGLSQLTSNRDESLKVLDREKYFITGKQSQSGLLTGTDGERSGHVSFLLE
eukprot:g6854.t1